MLLYVLTSCIDPGFLNSEEIICETKLTPGLPLKTEVQVKQNDITLDALRKSLSDYLQVTSVPSVNPSYDQLNESKAEDQSAPQSVEREDQCIHTCPSSRIPQVCEAQFSITPEVKVESSVDLPQAPHNTEIASCPFDGPLEVVERRYCTMCRLEQPLRAKHCKTCDKCVALHDHHCPWLGVCIGERNRTLFYWFLLFQTLEIWQAFHAVLFPQSISHLHSNSALLQWLLYNAVDLALIAVETFFGVLTTALLAYHSYLAATGQTTCEGYTGENVTGAKISYIKQAQRPRPFSLGLLSNLRLYCCDCLSRKPRLWSLPISQSSISRASDQPSSTNFHN